MPPELMDFVQAKQLPNDTKQKIAYMDGVLI